MTAYGGRYNRLHGNLGREDTCKVSSLLKNLRAFNFRMPAAHTKISRFTVATTAVPRTCSLAFI